MDKALGSEACLGQRCSRNGRPSAAERCGRFAASLQAVMSNPGAGSIRSWGGCNPGRRKLPSVPITRWTSLARRASASGEIKFVEAGLVCAADQMSATLDHHRQVHDLPARTHSNRRPRMRIALRPAAARESTGGRGRPSRPKSATTHAKALPHAHGRSLATHASPHGQPTPRNPS